MSSPAPLKGLPHGIKELDIPVVSYAWAYWILAIVAALAILFWLWKMFSKKKNVLALQKSHRQMLEELVFEEPRSYYHNLSWHLKKICDATCGTHIAEQTTDELLPVLKTYFDPPEDFLRRADLIKFANMQVTEEQAQKDKSYVLDYVNRLEAHFKAEQEIARKTAETKK